MTYLLDLKATSTSVAYDRLKMTVDKKTLLPTGIECYAINDEFGAENNVNLAAKLYLLYRNTDIDFLLYTGNSRSTRIGADFLRNISTNFGYLQSALLTSMIIG